MFNTGIHDHSEGILQLHQRRVLAKGLEFIPTPRPVPYNNIVPYFDQLLRNIRLKEQFGEQHAEDHKYLLHRALKLPNPSFHPKPLDEHTELLVQQCRHKLTACMYSSSAAAHCNMSKQDILALKQLKEDTRIVIKPADKNLGTTIVTRTWYVQEAKRLLAPPGYAIINMASWAGLLEGICNVVLDCCQHFNVDKEYNDRCVVDFLTSKLLLMHNFNCHTEQQRQKLFAVFPRFYLTIKVHKPKLQGRPIAAAHSWILTPLSTYFALLLQPILEHQEQWLKNTPHLISKLHTVQDDWQNVAKQLRMFTGDVESLYPNVPIEETISFFNTRWLPLIFRSGYSNEHGIVPLPSSINALKRLFALLMRNSYVLFDGQLYHQLQGLPMGTPAAPVIASLYMCEIERELPPLWKGWITDTLWCRYIDDIIFITWVSEEDCQRFMECYNQLRPTIRINWTSVSSHGEFLDLCIDITSNNTIHYSTHQKALNAYLYLPFRSFHTKHTKKGFIKGELLRYKRNSSTEAAFVNTKRLFFQRLRARGYPSSFLCPIFDIVRWETQASSSSSSSLVAVVDNKLEEKKKEDKTTPRILVVPHNPTFLALHPRELLTLTPTYTKLVTLLPDISKCITAWKLPPNLGNMLVRAELPNIPNRD